MKKEKPANASMTPAAAKAAAPIPPRLAETVTSVFASSISERMSVDMSAIALLARVPTVGSAGPVDRTAGEVVETLGATGGSSLIGAGCDSFLGASCRMIAAAAVPGSPIGVAHAMSHRHGQSSTWGTAFCAGD